MDAYTDLLKFARFRAFCSLRFVCEPLHVNRFPHIREKSQTKHFNKLRALSRNNFLTQNLHDPATTFMLLRKINKSEPAQSALFIEELLKFARFHAFCLLRFVCEPFIVIHFPYTQAQRKYHR